MTFALGATAADLVGGQVGPGPWSAAALVALLLGTAASTGGPRRRA